MQLGERTDAWRGGGCKSGRRHGSHLAVFWPPLMMSWQLLWWVIKKKIWQQPRKLPSPKAGHCSIQVSKQSGCSSNSFSLELQMLIFYYLLLIFHYLLYLSTPETDQGALHAQQVFYHRTAFPSIVCYCNVHTQYETKWIRTPNKYLKNGSKNLF